mmetsp:Transcript_23540/g.27006  ORF Transcript_23540/g.27006 Transcript_23540/m.27006 type:complete len:167 (+) Transcript_23540:1277-1777(+)
MFKIHVDLIPSRQHTLWTYSNKVNYQGHEISLHYYADKDSVSDLIEDLQDFPSNKLLSISDVPIDFSTEEGQQLLDVLGQKRVGRLEILNCVQSDESVDRLVPYLANTDNHLNSLILKLENTSSVRKILEALEHNYFFDYMELKTKEPVSSEVEALAEQFMCDKMG